MRVDSYQNSMLFNIHTDESNEMNGKKTENIIMGYKCKIVLATKHSNVLMANKLSKWKYNNLILNGLIIYY